MVLHTTQSVPPGTGRADGKALANLAVKDFQAATPSSHTGDLATAAFGLKENMERVLSALTNFLFWTLSVSGRCYKLSSRLKLCKQNRKQLMESLF